MGCVSSSKTTDDPTTSTEMNVSSTPDGKPLVEYHVSFPYSQDMDDWMKEYALENRIGNQEELHLFTFSDGKQFEYYMNAAGASESGFLYPSNWTEELDESLKPTKITEEQFIENMDTLTGEWHGAYYQIQADDNYGELLYVNTGQPLTGLGTTDAAAFLKNYIDFRPYRDAYGLVIQSPTANGQGSIVKSFAYEPKNHVLFEVEMTDFGSTSNTAWTDATYTSIAKAIETGTFTNHPGKMGFPA